jgi:hypothetical protein
MAVSGVTYIKSVIKRMKIWHYPVTANAKMT